MKPPDSKDQQSFAQRLLDLLEDLNIRYAIAGSVAAMAYSVQRLTVDLDLMLMADEKDLARLNAAITSWGIYIAPLESILENDIPHGLPFNVYDGSLGTKADFYVVPQAGLAGSAMARRRRINAEVLGRAAWFLAPEDVILYKLDYFQQSGGVSQKHPADIAKILAVSGEQLDLAYIAEWAEKTGVLGLWQALWDEFNRE